MTVLDSDGPARLKVGISIGDPSLDVVMATVQAAEAAGIDTVAVGDSEYGAESFTMLAAIAVLTERIGLVSSVAGWVRTPAITAQLSHTISALSKGRFSVGLGPLPKYRIEDWHGMEFNPILARFREYIVALAACLDAIEESPTNVDGQYFSTHGFVGPSFDRVRRSPIILAANQQRMTELGGEIADGVIFNGNVPLGFLETTGKEWLRAGFERAGRSATGFTMGVGRMSGISEDREYGYELARRSMAGYLEVPYFRKIMAAQGFEAELEIGYAAVLANDKKAQVASITDEMVDAICIAGTPDEALAKLRKYEGVVDSISLGGGAAMTVPPDQRIAHARVVIDILKELKG